MFDINGRFRAPTQNLLYLDRERPPRRRCVTMLSHTTFHGAIPYGYMVEGREFLPLPRSARLHACNQLPRSARLCCCSTTPKSPLALPSDADRLTVKCACAPALAGCMLVPHLRPALGRHLPQSLHDVRLIGTIFAPRSAARCRTRALRVRPAFVNLSPITWRRMTG